MATRTDRRAIVPAASALRRSAHSAQPMGFSLFLLSPFLLFPLAERLRLPPLIVPGIYLALWAAWEAYLHLARPDLWLRADLFLIVPAQIIVLVRGIRHKRPRVPETTSTCSPKNGNTRSS
jgi:hypothetical protein